MERADDRAIRRAGLFAMSAEERALRVKRRAAEIGFDACGIAAAGPIDPEDRLGDWLARGYHGDLDWIARTREIRQDVRLKLPGAQSVVAVACNYYAPRPEPAPGSGCVSRYAWGRDYHLVMRKPMAELAQSISEMAPQTQCYISVDSGPVLERAWAARAGIGWVGKNALLLREGLGSWFFLGIIATTLELAPDAPVANQCGDCARCMRACPTGAIVAPGIVDARRCISYYKAERPEETPIDIQERNGNRVFGCDACQEACPWNRETPVTRFADFEPRPGCANPNLDAWLAMDEAAFNQHFKGSPIRRAKFQGLRKNLLIAKRNSSRLG